MKKINFTKLTKPYYKNAQVTLEELIKINSTYDPKTITKEKPYGIGVSKALDYLISLGELYGFEVDRCHNYVSELTFGEGEKLISVFAHADIVPEGRGWDSDPFLPVVRKGNLYGRGATDDKGPLVAAFYAIKALKDNGLIKNYRVRLIVGGDEERGSSCLQYYFNELKKEQPTYGFTPDATFPLVYGEKGVTNFISEQTINFPEIISLKGGLAFNSVIDEATLVFLADDKFYHHLKKQKNVDVEVESEEVMVAKIKGVSAHGSMPNMGINAVIKALEIYGQFYQNKDALAIVKLFKNYDGKPFKGYAKGKELGETTYNVGIVTYENKKLTMHINFRYPEKVDATKFIHSLDKNSNFISTIVYESPPLLFDKKSTLVKTLLEAYQEETFDKKIKPITMGGGTYAKNAQNTVAFGPAMPYEVNNIHDANEFINLKNFQIQMAIYARAIYALGKLK